MAGKYDKNIKITVDDKGSLKQKTKDINKLNKAVDHNTKKSGNLDRNMKGNAKMSSNASKNFSKQAQGMQGILVPAYAEVAARVFALTAAYTALERAADYAILLKGQKAYAALTGKDMGLLAKQIQEVSGYMLDFEAASKSAALGTTAGLNIKAMTRMTKVARSASVALGRGMADSMDRLTRGIVKAEPEILDEIGIIIRLDTVYKEYARTLNKTTAQLSESEKLQARMNAILGQGEEKFKDLSEQVGANPFGKLSAVLMDIIKNGGSVIVEFFSPLIRALSDSTTLLQLLILLISKSLIGKIFPAFKNMGKGLSDVRGKLEKTTKSVKAFGAAIKSSLSAQTKLGQFQSSELINGLKKAGFVGGQAYKKGMKEATSDMGALLSKSVQKSIQLALAAGRASATRATDGVSTSKATAGMRLEDINRLDAMFQGLGKTLSGISKATKGSASAELLGIFSKLPKVIDASAKALKGLANGLAVVGKLAPAIKILSNAFNALVGVMGVVMMMKWVGQMALEMSDSMFKAHKALESLNGSLERVSETLQKRFKKGDKNIIGHSIVDSIASTEFKSNLAEQLNASIETATAKIDMELIAASTWGRFVDATYSFFNAGMADQLGSAISSGLVSMAGILDPKEYGKIRDNMAAGLKHLFQDRKISKVAKESTKAVISAAALALSVKLLVATKAIAAAGIATANPWVLVGAAILGITGTVVGLVGVVTSLDNVFNAATADASTMAQEMIQALDAVAEGTLSPTLAVQMLGEKFKAAGLETYELIDFYQKMGKATKLIADATADTTKKLNDLSAAWGGLAKTRQSFTRSLVKGGALKDFSDKFEQTKSAMKEVNDLSKKYQIIVKSVGASKLNPTDTKAIEVQKKAHAELLKEKARILETFYLIGDPKDNQKKLDALDKTLVVSGLKISYHQEKAYERLLGKFKDADGIVKGLMGGDVTALYEKEVKAAERQAKIKLEIQKLNAFEMSNTIAKASKNQEELQIRKDILVEKRKFIDEGDLEYTSLTAQIDNLNTEISLTGRVSRVLLKNWEKLTGHTATLGQNIKALREDSGGHPLFKVEEALMIEKAYNSIVMSLSKTYKESLQIMGIANTLSLSVKKGLISSKESTKLLKLWKLNNTTEGKLLKSKKASLKAEVAKIELEINHFKEHSNLIEARQAIAELESKIIDKGNQKLKKDIQVASLLLAYKKTEKELIELNAANEFKSVRTFFDSVSSGLGQTLSSAISDALMKKEPDDNLSTEERIRLALAQTASDATGNMISGWVTKGLFGNQGLLSGITSKMFGEDAANSIFPKTEAEVLQATLRRIRQLAEERGIKDIEKVLVLKRIDANTALTAATNPDGTVNWDKLDLMRDAIMKEMRLGKYAPAIDISRNEFDGLTDFEKDTGKWNIIEKKLVDNENFLTKIWQGLKSFFRDDTTISVPVSGVNVGTDVKTIKKVFNTAVDAVKEFTTSTETAAEIIKQTIPITDTKVVGAPTESEPLDQTRVITKIDDYLKFLEQGGGIAKILGDASIYKRSLEMEAKYPEKGFTQEEWFEKLKKSDGDLNRKVYDEETLRGKKYVQTSSGSFIPADSGVEFLEYMMERIDATNSNFVPVTAANRDALYPNQKDIDIGVFKSMEEGMKDLRLYLRGAAQLDVKRDSNLNNNLDFYLKNTLDNTKMGFVGRNGVVESDGTRLAGFNVSNGNIAWSRFTDWLHEVMHDSFREFKLDASTWGDYIKVSMKDMKKSSDTIEAEMGTFTSHRSAKLRIAQYDDGPYKTAHQRLAELFTRIKTEVALAPVGTSAQDVTPYGIWEKLTDRSKGLLNDSVTPKDLSNNYIVLENFLKTLNRNIVPITKVPKVIEKAIQEAFERMLNSNVNKTGIYRNNTGRLETKDFKQWIQGEKGKINPDWKNEVGKYGDKERAWKENARKSWLEAVEAGQSRAGGPPKKGQQDLFRVVPALKALTKAFDANLISASQGAMTIDALFKNPGDIRQKFIQLIVSLLPMILQGDVEGQKLWQPGSNYTSDFDTINNAGGINRMVSQDQNLNNIARNDRTWDNYSPKVGNEEIIRNATDNERNLGATFRQGIDDLIYNGRLDAKGLAMSFAQRAANSMMDAASGSFMKWLMMANGGVLSGGFQAFARGGLVNKPTLGLVGEGKYNEAIVPLPDGKSIPVIGGTGNTNNVVVNVSIDSEGNANTDSTSNMGEDQAKQLGYMISQAVQSELVQQKRPGGLLSQY